MSAHKPLHHYIVVRRDLPFGVILSMVAHAAGESFYVLPRGSSEKERVVSNHEATGSSPVSGSTFNPAETIAVVLGARNEGRLAKLAAALTAAEVRFVEIRETEGELAGQLLAIGIVPGDKAVIAPLVRNFHMFKELETAETIPNPAVDGVPNESWAEKTRRLQDLVRAAETQTIEIVTWRNLIAAELDPYAKFADIPRLIRELKAKAGGK